MSASMPKGFRAMFLAFAASSALLGMPTVTSAGEKQRELMRAAGVDIVGVCSAMVVSGKPATQAVAGRGFAAAKSRKIGKLTFDAVFTKSYGRGLSKTRLLVARTGNGECLTKANSNYESEALWQGISANLQQIGFRPTRKPIIASRMYMGGYNSGSANLLANGQAANAQTLTIISN